MKVCVSCYSFQIHGHFKFTGTILPTTPCPPPLRMPLCSDLALPLHLHQRPACRSPDPCARLPGQTVFLSFVGRGDIRTEFYTRERGSRWCSPGLALSLSASQTDAQHAARAPSPGTTLSTRNGLMIWATCTSTFSNSGFKKHKDWDGSKR